MSDFKKFKENHPNLLKNEYLVWEVKTTWDDYLGSTLSTTKNKYLEFHFYLALDKYSSERIKYKLPYSDGLYFLSELVHELYNNDEEHNIPLFD